MCIRDSFVDNVDDEFVRVADVLRRIFSDDVLRRSIGHAYRYYRRIRTNVIVGAERSRVQATVVVMARDPCDGPRCNQTDE